MNRLQFAAQRLHDGMQKHAGVSIRYRRPSANKEVRMKATPGRVITEVHDENGVMLKLVTRDFVISTKALAGFDPPNPIRNDEVYAEDLGHTFTVNAEDLFGSHYEEADSYGVAWRVHTKRDKRA